MGAHHTVKDEASVAVSYGYSTTSSKSVTELDDRDNATSNTATSTSKDASITTSSTDSAIRYTLKVGTGTRRFLFLGLFLCSLAALALYGKRRWLL